MKHTGSIRLYRAACIIVILLIAGIRIHLADIPFERDEGEYAYAGQMLMHGAPPYHDVYNMKFPGVYYLYALSFRVFGEDIRAPRYMVLVLQLISAFFIFLLARRAVDPLAGWLAAAVFMLWDISPGIQATHTNAEHFLVAFLVPALYFLYRGAEMDSVWDIFISGILLAIASMMKQHAIFFAVGGLTWLIYLQRMKSGRFLATYVLGILLPLLLVCMYLWHAGVWERFYFLTIGYAREYIGMIPIHDGIMNLNHAYDSIYLWSPLLLWCSLLSLAGLFIPFQGNVRSFILLFIVVSFAAVAPGLYFRQHYFLIMVPVVSLLFSYTAFAVSRWMSTIVGYSWLTICIVANVSFFIYCQRDYLLLLPSEQVTESLYPGTPFAESGRIASYIRQHSAPGDRICLVGAEPQLFFLSQRRSASGYVYVYALLEHQRYAERMTDEFIAESEHCRPEILVFSSYSVFEDGNNYDSRLYRWYTSFKNKYRLIASFTARDDHQRRLTVFDTIAPVDTFSPSLMHINVYKRIR